jgi:hypothetical protein
VTPISLQDKPAADFSQLSSPSKRVWDSAQQSVSGTFLRRGLVSGVNQPSAGRSILVF